MWIQSIEIAVKVFYWTRLSIHFKTIHTKTNCPSVLSTWGLSRFEALYVLKKALAILSEHIIIIATHIQSILALSVSGHFIPWGCYFVGINKSKWCSDRYKLCVVVDHHQKEKKSVMKERVLRSDKSLTP